MPRLWAISDLHVRYEENRRFLERLPAYPDDWLIVAGDVGETDAHLDYTWSVLAPKFARLLWVPGNHELWTLPDEHDAQRGEARYRQLVRRCRTHGVLTPEDPYPIWHGVDGDYRIGLLFVLYDYSFRPSYVPASGALAWARETGVVCTDEELLGTEPHASVVEWCDARVRLTEERLEAHGRDLPWVLVNHFPLRYDLVRLPRIPRFSLWCGTRRTEDWHTRFGAKVVISGHLHIRRTDWRDGVRFEEVSLGYPRDWQRHRPGPSYLRDVLPGRD